MQNAHRIEAVMVEGFLKGRFGQLTPKAGPLGYRYFMPRFPTPPIE
jgi:hypothetical protein